jgi:glycosyltransferase involved in cell wall biosynthesis
MKILFVSPSLPFPPDQGSYIRCFNLMKNLSHNHDVDLISFRNSSKNEENIAELEKYCRRVYLATRKFQPRVIQIPKVFSRFVRGRPFTVKYTESKDLGRLLYGVTERNDYDVIQFESSDLAANLRFVHPRQKAKTVLSLYDINFLRYFRMYRNEQSFYKRIKYFLTWFPMLNWEPKMALLCNKTIVVSEIDKILIESLEPTLDVSVVPNGVDTQSYLSHPLGGRRRNILIVGSMENEPNADAVKHFCNQIFPYIKKKNPECTLTIVGKNPPVEILQLDADPRITVKANVEDVRPYYKEALISAVPLRSGGGTRLKILESMALGTPVVSTSIGCEGLEVKNGRHILIADGAEDFANKTCTLMTSPTLWRDISQSARELVEEKYDWGGITKRLESIYEEVLKQDFS